MNMKGRTSSGCTTVITLVFAMAFIVAVLLCVFLGRQNLVSDPWPVPYPPTGATQPQNVLHLPPGQKLVQYDMSQKPGCYREFTFLTRGMRSGEVPETYSLVQMSERSTTVPDTIILLEEQAPIRAESSPVPDPTRK